MELFCESRVKSSNQIGVKLGKKKSKKNLWHFATTRAYYSILLIKAIKAKTSTKPYFIHSCRSAIKYIDADTSTNWFRNSNSAKTFYIWRKNLSE